MLGSRRFSGRAAGRAAAAFSTLAVLAASPVHAGAQAASLELAWPSAVAARYKLSFNGFDVGKYNFNSQFDGRAYQAASSADISALFGAFKWRGDIKSNGAIAGAAPQPSAYQLAYKSKKAVSVTLGFDASGVKSVAINPSKPPNPEAVPLKPEHYQHVLDPMTAILAISHPASADPCARKIPIFDGKARFDLVMSPKGEQKLKEKTPSGQPTELTVCRVKYVPIAGHKPKDFVNPWVDYAGIEIALRHIPSAGLYVPYRINIPTSIGAATMTAETVTITKPDRTEIALTQ